MSSFLAKPAQGVQGAGIPAVHRFVCVMGPPAGYFARGGKWEIPDEALEVYRRDNLLLEVMFPISWGGLWDYPYRRRRS